MIRVVSGKDVQIQMVDDVSDIVTSKIVLTALEAEKMGMDLVKGAMTAGTEANARNRPKFILDFHSPFRFARDIQRDKPELESLATIRAFMRMADIAGKLSRITADTGVPEDRLGSMGYGTEKIDVEERIVLSAYIQKARANEVST
jgi:hypothetical protein